MIKNRRLKKVDLAKVTGIKPRTLLDWTQKGYLIPDDKVEGQGRISFYSPENAVQAKVLELLSKSGISLKNFSDIVRKIDNPKMFDPFLPMIDDMYLLIVIDDCKQVRISHYTVSKDRNPLLEIVKTINDAKFNYILLINLKKIMLEIRKSMDSI